MTTPKGTGRWHVTLSWTDVKGHSTDVAVTDSNSDYSYGGSLVFSAHAEAQIRMLVSAEGDVSGSVCDALFVIERLTKIPSF